MKLLISLLYYGAVFAIGEGLQTRQESAPFMMMATYQGFEERVYPARRWITTTMEGPALDPLMSPMFWTLYGYIDGQNDQNASIPMTTPTSTLVQPTSSGYRYTMAFYLPSAYQDDVPNGGPDVTVEDRPRLTILTRRFGGYATDEKVASEREAMERLIRSAGLEEEVDFDTYYLANFDDPFVYTGRRNELWFVRKAPETNAM